MTLNEIKQAVRAGKTVHWANGGYQVIESVPGRFLIVFDLGGPRMNATGLTCADGKTMSEKEEDFFIAE